VLGRLRADAFLGGGMRLDETAAEQAVARLSEAMGCSTQEAARGVIAVANEHMARALRAISIQRGEDPRDFTLVSFGGAGGLHVCALAEALEMRQAMVPVHAGVLSALGMLATRPGRQLSRTLMGVLVDLEPTTIEQGFETLAADGRDALRKEGQDPTALEEHRSVDLRYLGQSYALNVSWQGDAAAAVRRFEIRHEERYGHRLDAPVELVNLRMGLHGRSTSFSLASPTAQGLAAPASRVRIPGIDQEVPVYRRGELAVGQRLDGPTIVTETVATTWIAPDWRCENDRWGNLMLQLV